MDVALERGGRLLLDRCQSGFNPCFRGCRSGTRRPQDPIPEDVVSILVFVDVALELPGVIWNPPSYAEFQSLFSWMSLWNLNGPGMFPRKIGVSILVFVDVALEPWRRSIP